MNLTSLTISSVRGLAIYKKKWLDCVENLSCPIYLKYDPCQVALKDRMAHFVLQADIDLAVGSAVLKLSKLIATCTLARLQF